MAYHCAVVECSNGGYRLNKWKKEECSVHRVLHGSDGCDCHRPFSLWTIPPRKTRPVPRDKWKVLINRVHPATNKLLSPSKDQRVCSRHFKDGRPTAENPYPTEHLGYPDFHKKVARVLMYEDRVLLQASRRGGRIKTDAQSTIASEVGEEDTEQDPGLEIEQIEDKPLSVNELLSSVFVLLSVVLLLTRQMRSMFLQLVQALQKSAQLENEVRDLKKALEDARQKEKIKDDMAIKPHRVCQRPLIGGKKKVPPNIFQRFLTDKNVNYYTGVESKALIRIIHDYIKGYVVRRWHGVSNCSKRKRNFQKIPCRFGPSRFLKSIDELVLVLMRLRLGLNLKDLSDRFRICPSLGGKIFTSWIKALAAVLSNMVRIPDLETVIATKPLRYRSRNMTNLFAIIDCTEVFIETPQDLSLQSVTWSDYKHHNTLKFLVAVCPNSYICYVSPAYEGRISDTELTKDCGFLRMLPKQACVMADKGFNLTTECAGLGLTIEVPPGRRGQSQMPMAAVQKTKKIANLRILVEQVIGRLKSFQFLKYKLSLTSTDHIDEAIIVCAALCNLKKPLYSM